MDKKQFSVLITGLKAAYPRFSMLNSAEEIEFWYRLLNDIDYTVASNAVMEYISTNVFPPSIADIRRLCVDRTERRVVGFDEAWGSVQKAIARYGYSEAVKGIESLDPVTADIVRNLGWRNLCTSENPEADRANFRKAYERRAEELGRQRLIPGFVAEQKRRIQENYIGLVEGGNGGNGGHGSCKGIETGVAEKALRTAEGRGDVHIMRIQAGDTGKDQVPGMHAEIL